MVNIPIPKAPPVKFVELRKSAGILDDYSVRKNLATREGTVEKVPVNNSDIVNKKYLTDNYSTTTTNDGLYVNITGDTMTGALVMGVNGTGADLTLNSDTSNVNLVWDHDATTSNPLLKQTLEDGRLKYWEISGTDTAPQTMSTGIFSIIPTFSTGTTGRGANLLYFAPTDSKSVSTGTNFTRILRGEATRSGTKTTTAADQIYISSMLLADNMTYNAAGGTSNERTGYEFILNGLPTFSNATAEGVTYRGFDLQPGSSSLSIINSTGTNVVNIYGFDIRHTYAEAVIGGAVTATQYGIYYHPTMSSAADVEYAFRADRAGILLASDGTSNTQSTGRLVLGAGSDAEIYYDGTDLRVNPDLVGSGDFKIDGNENITGEAKGQRMVLLCGLSGSIVAGAYLNSSGVASTSTKGFRMPRAGSIVGISLQTSINTFVSSGNATAQARVNGSSVFTTTVAISADGDFGGQSTQARGTDTFSAGDIINAFVNIDSGSYIVAAPIVVIEVQFDT